jgi:uncharacterized lipoprotein YbaY
LLGIAGLTGGCDMRIATAFTLAFLAAAPAAAQDSGGISSTALSRCAGKIGLETRQADAAFVGIMLNGMPWVNIERTEEKVGSQFIATTVTGTGVQRLRRGQMVAFRFICLLDDKGEAVMFHSTRMGPDSGMQPTPATLVGGTVGYREKMALPQGAELRVQLLDIAKAPQGEIVAEQVVRSGWEAPILFALRAPPDLTAEGRRLVVVARLVVGGKTLFQLKEPHAIAADGLHKPLELVMAKMSDP